MFIKQIEWIAMRCLNASQEEWFEPIAWGVCGLKVKSHQTLRTNSVEFQLNAIKMMFQDLFVGVRIIACTLANQDAYFKLKFLY